ncbi:MAG TPA: acetate--CoA ligase family protein [Candidatus Micrarchaeia archaeon]|nr:acetate--CoA ligase family protein [Candidatus Micrarchaeia archaeon]
MAEPIAVDVGAVGAILERALTAGRAALDPTEVRAVCRAYGIPIPDEGLAASADEAAAVAARIGFPVACKVVSPDVLHKSEVGGVRTGLGSAEAVREAHRAILAAVTGHAPQARLEGVLVQAMLPPGLEVIIGTATDRSFGSLVAFGLGGVLVEVLRDVTFRLAPVDLATARQMLASITAHRILDGVRGQPAVAKDALAAILVAVSQLAADFPQIAEIDCNPVIATAEGAAAADVRILLAATQAAGWPHHQPDAIRESMRRLFHPESIAVIGASQEDGKIGNSVMRNLVAGGYRGTIYPINPGADAICGLPAYPSIAAVPGPVDVAVFAIPARLVPAVMEEVGRKGVAAAILIPSGFAETGEVQLQEEVQRVARRWGVRFLGPNIYGLYYTPERLCATFCTPYDVRGPVALTSQSGGIGMAILGFARSTKMGVSAIVGLGNKADVDEDDLLTFFEQDDATQCIAMHMEDLKDGRAFLEAAQRVSRVKPVVVLKAGRTPAGARAAGSHTGALAGDDRVYDDLLRASGVVRAPGLREMLEIARCLPMLPTPRGENVVIVTGAGGSGVLLSDACVDHGLALMTMPADLDRAFRALIPPFGAAGNPVDITGGEPPATYRRAVELGLQDDRIHALVLGYWHTIITPPMVFAELLVDVVESARRRGIHKPVVASLAGDVEVEQAAELCFAHRIPAFPYTTETPVAMLGAKYRWARAAGLVEMGGRAGTARAVGPESDGQ